MRRGGDRHRAVAAEERRDLGGRAHRRGQPDSLRLWQGYLYLPGRCLPRRCLLGGACWAGACWAGACWAGALLRTLPTPTTSDPPTDRRGALTAGGESADSPIWALSASSRSSESARWAPRLFPASACTSSTITVCTLRSVSRARDVSSRNSDSGVVIRMSGGLPASRRLSSAAVSPERTATLISGSGSPRRWAAWRRPASGARRFRSMSTASALSGETYSTRQRWAGSSGAGAAARRSSAQRNAARVLPDPVGAMTRVCLPLLIDSHACTCAAWALRRRR